MSELTNQSGNVGNNGLLQQGEAAHDGFNNEKKREKKGKHDEAKNNFGVGLTLSGEHSEDRGKSGSPFMMYSFSDEPGRARALNKWLSSCSVKGAISAGTILKNKSHTHTEERMMC